MSKLRLVQVGIGGMGRRWLSTVLESDEVTFAGFVEINPEIAEQQAHDYGLDRALIFESLDEALQHVAADGIIDVTPPQFHKQISLTALEAGIPVLSEKPLANTLSDAQAIVDKANETGVLHMVAQNYRYSAEAQTLKSAIAGMGDIGAVATSFYKGPHFGGFREQMPYPLIIDMAIHHFDLLRYLIGSNPVSTFGRTWDPPWSWFAGDTSASVSFAFANGTVATYTGSWCAPGQETTWNGDWRFDAEKGVVTMIQDRVRAECWTGVNGFNNVYAPVEEVAPVAMPRQAQAYLLHEFYEAVTNGASPVTTCQDNIHSLRMVFDAVESFETGRTVTR